MYGEKEQAQMESYRKKVLGLITVVNDEYDSCCFGVDINEKLSDDRYMVFYNQPASPKNEIEYSN